MDWSNWHTTLKAYWTAAIASTTDSECAACPEEFVAFAPPHCCFFKDEKPKFADCLGLFKRTAEWVLFLVAKFRKLRFEKSLLWAVLGDERGR